MSRHDIETFDAKKFIKEIKDFMRKHNISTRKFAKMSKSSPVTLTRVERGETGITIETAKKFIAVMNNFRPDAA